MQKPPKAVLSLLFLSVFSGPVFSQTPSVIENRLSKTWSLSHTEQDGKVFQNDGALNEFLLILNPDHSVLQGIQPDGLIRGTWTINEKEMILIIKDDMTATEYRMKIFLLTADKLVLENFSEQSSLFIHYMLK